MTDLEGCRFGQADWFPADDEERVGAYYTAVREGCWNASGVASYGPSCFCLSQVTQSFVPIRKKAGIDELHFHDSRHEAITHLAKKLS